MTIERVGISWGRSGSAFSLASFLFLGACAGDSTPTAADPTGETPSGATDGTDDTDGTDGTDGTDSTGSTSGMLDGGGKVTSPKLDAGTKDGGAVKAADASSVTASDASTTPVDKTITDASMGMPTVADASKPSTGATDAGTDAGTTVVADAGPPALPPDPGKGDGKDVVTIGDSWMSNTLQFEGTGGGMYAALQRAGYRYKNHAVQGVKLLEDNEPYGPAIPTQWDDATKANPNIKTVVMTAGGNDILQDPTLRADCRAVDTACDDELKKLGVGVVTLWNKMAAAGVQDIVHILYAADADDNTLIKQAKKNNEGLQLLCSKVMAPARCHVIESDAYVNGDYAIDGIHPTSAANDRLAAAVEKFMADNHIRR